MSLGKDDQEFLMKQKTFKLTVDEMNLIRHLIISINVAYNLHVVGWDMNESIIRRKEKERDSIDRLTKMLNTNISALKELFATIGINYALALKAKEPEETKLNNLQMYELRYILEANLKTESANSKDIESLLQRATDLITWYGIGKIESMYSDIQLGLYRGIITGKQTTVSIRQDK